MASVFYEQHPVAQQAIRAVVMLLDRGQQPPDDMDLMPAIDFEYAQYEQFDDAKPPELYLTEKGSEAALRWRHGDDSHGGNAA